MELENKTHIDAQYIVIGGPTFSVVGLHKTFAIHKLVFVETGNSHIKK